MHLSKWLDDNGMTQDEFRIRLSPCVTQGLVSQWVRGVTRVTLDYGLQIETITNGAVPVKDCADMYLKGTFVNLLRDHG